MTKVMAYNPVVLKSTVIAITKAMASMQRLVNSTVFLLDIFLEQRGRQQLLFNCVAKLLVWIM